MLLIIILIFFPGNKFIVVFHHFHHFFWLTAESVMCAVGLMCWCRECWKVNMGLFLFALGNKRLNEKRWKRRKKKKKSISNERAENGKCFENFRDSQCRHLFTCTTHNRPVQPLMIITAFSLNWNRKKKCYCTLCCCAAELLCWRLAYNKNNIEMIKFNHIFSSHLLI